MALFPVDEIPLTDGVHMEAIPDFVHCWFYNVTRNNGEYLYFWLAPDGYRYAVYYDPFAATGEELKMFMTTQLATLKYLPIWA